MTSFSLKGRKILYDLEDAPKLVGRSWYLGGNGYVATYDKKTRKCIYLHRYVFPKRIKRGLEVDHINRNTLDNRKSNLRLVRRGQNIANCRKRLSTHKFRGVFFCKDKKVFRWAARISFRGKTTHIGYFSSEAEAAARYNAEALRLYGPNTYLNKVRIKTPLTLREKRELRNGSIMKEIESGTNRKTIAKKFGLSEGAISWIIREKKKERRKRE